MTIGRTILEQLGGNKFVAMTGAKHFVGFGNGVQFAIGRNISRSNCIVITQNGKDLYDVAFWRFTPKTGMAMLSIYKDVGVEDLRGTFTAYTGMYCTLGTVN